MDLLEASVSKLPCVWKNAMWIYWDDCIECGMKSVNRCAANRPVVYLIVTGNNDILITDILEKMVNASQMLLF